MKGRHIREIKFRTAVQYRASFESWIKCGYNEAAYTTERRLFQQSLTSSFRVQFATKFSLASTVAVMSHHVRDIGNENIVERE